MDLSEHEKEKVERLRRAMYSRSLADKLKERERRPLGQVDGIVGENFVEPEKQVKGTTVAPRTIGFARTALWWLLGGAIVFFIGAISFFAYYFLFGAGSFAASSGNITISVSGPPQIEGGTRSEFQIVVVNRNKVALQLADLIVTYPQGTRSPTDFATDLPSQRIPLGSIETGGTRQGTISAILSGHEGDHATVKVELEYRIQGSSAIFVTSTDYGIVFSSSPLSLTAEGNKETIAGQPVEMTISVASNTNAPVKDVLVSAQYPFGFKFSSASPAPSSVSSSQSGLWQIGDLSPGQRRTITIRGSLGGEAGDDRIFRFTAGTRSNTASSTIETTLAEHVYPISISESFLGLAISVNGTAGSTVTVSPDQKVTVSIGWKNNLPTAITDAVIVAKLSGLVIDGTTVRSNDGFYRSNDNIMLWDKTTSKGALASLPPGDSGKVEFSFQMPGSQELGGLVNPQLNISINAAGKRVSESGVPENLQSSASAKIALASEFYLTAQGLYYANPFGSVGPMPPKAGTETTYAIIFTVTNTTNAISEAKVIAHLPPYVRWIGIYSPSSESISFNQNDGTVSWNIGAIAPGVGLNGTTPRQAAIAIGFTPSTSQIGQQPALLTGIELSGIDPSKADATSGSNSGTGIPRTTLKANSDVTTNLLQVAKTSKDAPTPPTDPGFSTTNATVVK